MISVLSRDQIRALDRHAIESHGVSGLALMENAGRGAAELISERAKTRPGLVVIVCGTGNNGGDGFVVARRLAAEGQAVRVFFVGPRETLAGDALVNHDRWTGAGGSVEAGTPDALGPLAVALQAATIVVDAVLGTGLSRPVSGPTAAVLELMSGAPGLRIALDLPSGLDANTGQPLGVSMRAHETVTFAHYKLGLLTSRGADHAGRVTVVNIGIPAGVAAVVGESARLLEPSDVAAWLVPRARSTHKGSAGRVVAVAGSPGKTGAALLVARGALRAGAGLVTLSAPPDTADALDRRVLEEMTLRIDPARVEESLGEHLSAADAVVVGPGIGLGEPARRIADFVVLRHPGFVVVDADALTLFAGRLEELRAAPGPRLLTPHPGEMGRLLGVSTSDVEADRFGALSRAVERAGSAVLLKGARTLIGAPGSLPVVNGSGHPVLATAGAGDVLAGIAAALYCSMRDGARAACAAAFVHGRAGERWASETGSDRGLLAHEIADGVPGVLAEIQGSAVLTG